MTIPIEYIRKRLMQEKYGEFTVTDLGRFTNMVARIDANTFTNSGLDSIKRANDWKKSATPYQPLFLAPQLATPNQFINCTKEMNQKNPRLSECSNFAYHAIGVLLDDPAIRADYNVVVVGMMGGMHNIAVMIPKGPKGIDIPAKGPLPEGSLIVDPWAVGMGHDPQNALAVPPEQFAYYPSLYKKFTVHWQSNDEKHAEQIAELPAQSTLKPYSGESPTVESQGLFGTMFSFFATPNFSSSSSGIDPDLELPSVNRNNNNSS